jgi:hypothetical protein
MRPQMAIQFQHLSRKMSANWCSDSFRWIRSEHGGDPLGSCVAQHGYLHWRLLMHLELLEKDLRETRRARGRRVVPRLLPDRR